MSAMPCNTQHVPQNIAVSLCNVVNQKMISFAPSTETVFAYPDSRIFVG